MSTREREREWETIEPSEPESHRTLYIIIAVVFIALAVFASVVHKQREQNEESAQLAQMYVTAIETAGFDAPDSEAVERLFGTDGGTLCELTGSGTGEALLHQMVASGAAGPGLRSVPTGDELEEMLQRGQLAVAVYCPEKIHDYTSFMESLDVSPVITIGTSAAVP